MARETREVWERRVRRWERSGLAAAAFAAREGVNPRTLAFWRWKLGRSSPHAAERSSRRRGRASSAPAPLRFVELVGDAPRSGGGGLEVVVEQRRVRIACRDAGELARVLERLGGLS